MFIKYVSAKEVPANAKMPPDCIIFPFCKKCRKIVSKLHEKHSQIQSLQRNIRQVMGNIPAVKALRGHENRKCHCY